MLFCHIYIALVLLESDPIPMLTIQIPYMLSLCGNANIALTLCSNSFPYDSHCYMKLDV